MSNTIDKPLDLIGIKVRHNFSRNIHGTITKTRTDKLNYSYFVEWDNAPERSDWYNLGVLEKLELPTPEPKEAPLNKQKGKV